MKIKKLNAFRESAKKSSSDSEVHRIYVTFESLEDFTEEGRSTSSQKLRRYLDEQDAPDPKTTTTPARTRKPKSGIPDPIPTPPAFYAEPRLPRLARLRRAAGSVGDLE